MAEISFASPIAAARRREKLALKQMQHDLAIQQMRGQQELEQGRERAKQRQQQMVLQRMLGEHDAFSVDATLARHDKIAAEEQRRKERPVALRNLKTLTRQKEFAENLVHLTAAYRDGQDLGKVELHGPMTPELRARLIAQAKQTTNKEAQQMLNALRQEIQREGSKQYQKGKKRAGAKKLQIRHDTIGGIVKSGYTHELGDDAQGKPKKVSKSRRFGKPLKAPKKPWHLPHPTTSKGVSVGALKNTAGGAGVRKIQKLHGHMVKAHRAHNNIIRHKEGSKKRAQLEVAFAKWSEANGYGGKPAFDVYWAANTARVSTLTGYARKFEPTGGWLGPGEGAAAREGTVAKARQKADQDTASAVRMANSAALKRVARRIGINAGELGEGITNDVAKRKLQRYAEKVADTMYGMREAIQDELNEHKVTVDAMKAELEKLKAGNATKAQINIHMKNKYGVTLQRAKSASYMRKLKSDIIARERSSNRWKEIMRNQHGNLLQIYNAQKQKTLNTVLN